MTEPEPAAVVLDGILTVRTIAAIHGTLRETLASHSAVRVDCAAAETVDLSFIQLLLAARQSARAAGQRLMLAVPASGALRAALEQGGFLGQPGADPFWSAAE